MDRNTRRLYTGEKLSKKEEILLIEQLILELNCDINIAEIEISASKRTIKYFEERLNKLKNV